jgi:hypothetical protein
MARDIELTEEEIRKQADQLARQALGLSGEEAWRRVQAGEFEGTLLASRLTQLHFLLDEPYAQAAE